MKFVTLLNFFLSIYIYAKDKFSTVITFFSADRKNVQLYRLQTLLIVKPQPFMISLPRKIGKKILHYIINTESEFEMMEMISFSPMSIEICRSFSGRVFNK